MWYYNNKYNLFIGYNLSYIIIIIRKILICKTLVRFFLIFIRCYKLEVINLAILDRIIELLGERNQQDLTDYLGLKKSAFTDWKGGKSNSYQKYLVQIAEYFNVSIDYLVTGKITSDSLSPKETNLIMSYRELSEQGQEYIEHQIFIAKEIYKKQDISEPAEAVI